MISGLGWRQQAVDERRDFLRGTAQCSVGTLLLPCGVDLGRQLEALPLHFPYMHLIVTL